MAGKPGRPKKVEEVGKFDPTKQEDEKVVEKPKASAEISQVDLVKALMEQVTNLTQQVATLQAGQKQLGSDVETYREESAAQKMGSMEQARKARMSKIKVMEEKLSKDEKVNMLVPFEQGEKKGARLHVQVNGYTYVHSDGLAGIPKGVYTSVPKGIFDIASYSLGQQIENIGFSHQIDVKEVNADGQRFDPERLMR